MNCDERIILHCDINNFYASVECATRPDLKDKPVAVCGDPKKRTGIVLAKNQLAKKFGVSTGDAIWEAKLKCPDLVCLAPHHSTYEKISKQIIEIYKCYTDQIEPFGIDECWLDLTTCQKLFKDPEHVASEIRERIKSEIGVTASVGISFCKLFAKLGSDLKKPDAQTVITRQNFKKLIYPLPIDAIIGIGRRMKKSLLKMNIRTLGDLAQADVRVLQSKFGIIGPRLKEKLLGFDFDPVANIDALDPVKSVGNGTTTIKDIVTEAEVKQTIQHLACSVAKRLREKQFLAKVISVSIKNSDLHTLHHEKTIFIPTNDEVEITRQAMQVVREFWHFDEPIRSVRICCSGLIGAQSNRQTNFFCELQTPADKINVAIDTLNKKYHKQVVRLACVGSSNFINPDFLGECNYQ